jgi:DNA-binding NarL/FixJ family response regulator
MSHHDEVAPNMASFSPFSPLTRVLVCDNQPITIAGMRALLNMQTEFFFAESASSLEAALDFIRNHELDVLIVDKAFGLTEIGEFLASIQENGENRPAMVLWGSYISEADTLRLLRLGVRGILRKTAEIPTLMACLRAVARGTFWVENDLFNVSISWKGTQHSRNALTAREVQVLELVEGGMKNKEIAQSLGIKAGTVKIHMRHIFEKTGARDRRSLALAGFFATRSVTADTIQAPKAYSTAA